MTFEDLQDLRTHIQNRVGYNVILGDSDNVGNSYPIIKITLDGDYNVISYNERASVINDDLQIKIIVDKKDDLEAFRVRDLVIEQLGIFKSEKGMNFVPDRGSRSYTESTFEITINFLFSNFAHNTTD